MDARRVLVNKNDAKRPFVKKASVDWKPMQLEMETHATGEETLICSHTMTSYATTQCIYLHSQQPFTNREDPMSDCK